MTSPNNPPDESQPPATYYDFYEELRGKTPQEKAALIWRMPSPVVVHQDG